MGTARHCAWSLDRALPLNPAGVELLEGTDFDDFARTRALACPNLADLSPVSRRAQFQFRLKILRLGAVTLASGTSSAYRASPGESSTRTLYVPHRGTYRFRIGSLERVHERLRQPAEDDTVTRIALAEGFPHLGDFAGRFKAHFGESPSEVLRRARERRA